MMTDRSIVRSWSTDVFRSKGLQKLLMRVTCLVLVLAGLFDVVPLRRLKAATQQPSTVTEPPLDRIAYLIMVSVNANRARWNLTYPTESSKVVLAELQRL